MTLWEKRRCTSREFQSEVRLDSMAQEALASISGLRRAGCQHKRLVRECAAQRSKGAEQPSGPGANKRVSSEALLAHIRAIHVEVKQEYGIKARGKKKFVVTTDSKHELPIAANLLQRNFTPAAPNQV